MKKYILLFLCLSLVFLSSCAKDRTQEKVLEKLEFPFQAECSFSLGDVHGKAHLNLTLDTLTLGITDGVLQGVVASASKEGCRFLYDGLDFSFADKQTENQLTSLFDAFLFLKEQTFSAKTASEQSDTFVFTFDYRNAQLTYAVKKDYSPSALSFFVHGEALTLTFP